MKKQDLLNGGLETVTTAARRLSISRNTLYQWMHRGQMPYTCVNNVYRIPTLALDDMLTAGLHLGPAQEHIDQ